MVDWSKLLKFGRTCSNWPDTIRINTKVGGQHYSVLALNIVDSSTLVFIPIVSGQFEQVLLNLSSFDQSTIFSRLRKLVIPKKSERHSQSFV